MSSRILLMTCVISVLDWDSLVMEFVMNKRTSAGQMYFFGGE